MHHRIDYKLTQAKNGQIVYIRIALSFDRQTNHKTAMWPNGYTLCKPKVFDSIPVCDKS